MKKIIFALTLLIYSNSFSQKDETIKWIDENSIKIEDANPDTELSVFRNNTPDKFANARIFGFGEASHNTKEFFDIKAKFFKHLVKTQGIKTFIIEDQYQIESGINEWISGGEGDIKTIGNNFKIGFWNRKEVTGLLQWMRNYNQNNHKEEQIRFYGMDVQVGDGLNIEIREFASKHEIPISEELLLIADSCANKKIDYSNNSSLSENHIPELKKIEQTILAYKANDSRVSDKEFNSIIRVINYLIKYTHLTQDYKKEVRDLKMFENVKWIIDNEAKNGKAFVWAHNEHINKKEFGYSGSGSINLGNHLKKYYNDDYYSVGFDFGLGKIRGYVVEKNKQNYWKTYEIEKPVRKTYAQTLVEGKYDIYFVDMDRALLNESTNFFSIKKKHLIIGAGGYKPKPMYKNLGAYIYTEAFDGLIFVKNISPVTW